MNVELRNCSELSQPEIRRVLSAELSAHLAEERSADVTRIIIECNGPRAVLRVGDPLSRKVVQRTIDLGAYEAEGSRTPAGAGDRRAGRRQLDRARKQSQPEGRARRPAPAARR